MTSSIQPDIDSSPNSLNNNNIPNQKNRKFPVVKNQVPTHSGNKIGLDNDSTKKQSSSSSKSKNKKININEELPKTEKFFSIRRQQVEVKHAYRKKKEFQEDEERKRILQEQRLKKGVEAEEDYLDSVADQINRTGSRRNNMNAVQRRRQQNNANNLNNPNYNKPVGQELEDLKKRREMERFRQVVGREFDDILYFPE